MVSTTPVLALTTSLVHIGSDAPARATWKEVRGTAAAADFQEERAGKDQSEFIKSLIHVRVTT